MRIDRVSLNLAALANIKEDEFYLLVKGGLDRDKTEAWKLFQKESAPFRKNTKGEELPKE